jgi:hypothetical protein
MSDSASWRERAATAGAVAITLSALLALLTLMEPSLGPHRQSVATVAALAAIAFFACSNIVVIARYQPAGAISDKLLLDATGVIALVALSLAGPAIALLASAAPDLVIRWRGPNRLRPISRLANFASYAAATVLADRALVLLGQEPGVHAVTVGAVPALLVAGVVWFTTNYFVARGLVAMLAEGRPVLATVRSEFLPALPSVAVMIASAAATGVASALLGPLGLIGLAFAVLVPQMTVATLAWCSPPAGTLEIDAGRARYAAALCNQLELDRRQRRVVSAAARGDTGVNRLSGGLGDIWYAVGAARFYQRERFDGSGDFRLSGVMIPIESRVLAVADAWAKLTAKGTLSMSQAAAVAALERHQPRFDPRVVAAARALIATDPAAEEPGCRIPAPTTAARRLVTLVGAH